VVVAARDPERVFHVKHDRGAPEPRAERPTPTRDEDFDEVDDDVEVGETGYALITPGSAAVFFDQEDEAQDAGPDDIADPLEVEFLDVEDDESPADPPPRSEALEADLPSAQGEAPEELETDEEWVEAAISEAPDLPDRREHLESRLEGAPDPAPPKQPGPKHAAPADRPPVQPRGNGSRKAKSKTRARPNNVVASPAADAALRRHEELRAEIDAQIDAEVQVEAQSTGAEGGPEESDLLTVRPLPRVMAVANQKGGVGKTTTTVNLGAALAELDYRVLVIDLDPQGNATTGLGIDGRNFELSMYDVIMREAALEDCIEPTSLKNLFVAPATIDLAGVEIELVPAFSRELKLKRAIDTVVDDFDFIIIDCPPSLGLITVNGLAAAGEVLVPIQCEYYALEGLSQLLRNVHLVASNLNPSLEVSTIVLTMYQASTRLAVEVANEVRSHFAGKVCRSVIPRSVRLSEAPSFGQPITVFDPTSRGAIAYRELAKEVSNGAPRRAG
jgi:chromosome partitioning protein